MFGVCEGRLIIRREIFCSLFGATEKWRKNFLFSLFSHSFSGYIAFVNMSATTAAAAAPLKGKVGVEEGEQARVHKIRITLSSRNVKNLEKGAALLS